MASNNTRLESNLLSFHKSLLHRMTNKHSEATWCPLTLLPITPKINALSASILILNAHSAQVFFRVE
jgi:hypothetical protein